MGPATRLARGDVFPGLMISAMLLASVAHGLAPGFPQEVGVLAAWVAGCAVWGRLPGRARLQVGLMIGIGLACIAAVATRGVAIEWGDVTGRTLPILTLLAGVAFLRLAYRAGDGNVVAAPRGFGAYLRTMVGVHLFAAVINMSALVVFTDRLVRSAPLARREIAMLGRSFSMIAYYSPFVGGVALALSLVPDVRFPVFVLTGVVLACIGFLIIAVLGRWEEGEAIAEFRGYPFRAESLWLPLTLVGAVTVTHWAWPSVPILFPVALFAPLLAAAALVARVGTAGATRILTRFAMTELSGMSGELSLFLAAGVLGGGLSAVVGAFPSLVPQFALTAATATLALSGIAVLGMAGVHPLVSVTTLIALTLPASPPPTLLATVCVVGWGLGSSVSPYSGINLVLSTRCGVSSWVFPRWNAFYCAATVLSAGVVLRVQEALLR